MDIPPESLPIFARQTLSSFREPPVRLIVVIGAGIAGLAAARRLRALHYGVVILEARNRYGGRIFSDCNGVDFSSNYMGYMEHSALHELCDSINYDLSKKIAKLESRDALAYPISGSSLSLYFLRPGYRPILTLLAADLNIKYNETVVEVDAIEQAPFIVVKTESGQRFVADGVICTVPISLLKEGAINFIPSPFNDSLDDFTMEALNNVIMEFPESFWPSSPDTFTLGSGMLFQSLTRCKGLKILIVTTSDPYHEQASVDELVGIIMKIISAEFPDAPYPISAVRTAWCGDRFARGAFPRRANADNDSKWWISEFTASSPLAFAGDACTSHRIGNIESAIKSAWAATKHLHDYFGKLSPRFPPWSSNTISSKSSSTEFPVPAIRVDSASPPGAPPLDKSELVEEPAEPVRPLVHSIQEPMELEHDLNSRDKAALDNERGEEVSMRDAEEPEPEPLSRRKSSDQSKKEKTGSSKKERGGTKAISKYITRLVKEMGPTLKSKHAEYIRSRVTERMIEEWKAKGQIADFLTSERKQRIRHFVQKYIDARSKPPPQSNQTS